MKSMKDESSTVKNWLSTPFVLIALTLIHELFVKLFVIHAAGTADRARMEKWFDWIKEYVITINTRVKLHKFSDFELKTAELA